MDFDTGGKAAIDRLIEAYGFTTRQQLCEQLGVSKSTLANRYLRDTFPADFVVQCALETGASIVWLATGNGPMFDNATNDMANIKRLKLVDGKLYESNYYLFDKAFLPENLHNPSAVLDGKTVYIVDLSSRELSNGKWLIEVEGETSIKDLTRIPVGRVRVNGNGDSFECGVDDIKILAKVAMTCSK
ncbi:phage repressor protein CI [Serratia liquefaciens]|uniref:Phage repressor protein n=1 Tax=Serratia liquefaciens TaxID=614 RepID=A0A515D424_SERLI|nr:phage repressor protein CI [Serratia liquefaciens]QDL35159.1 phage repressor protein [Serratia liquefaciens]